MIQALVIVEIAGMPKELLKEGLEKHVDSMQNVKDLKIISKKISDPKEIENSNGVFTCFAEVEIEVPDILSLTQVLFDYMPSSIEILEPATLALTSLELTDIMNNLAGRIHSYEEIAQLARFKIKELNKKVETLEKEKQNPKESAHKTSS